MKQRIAVFQNVKFNYDHTTTVDMAKDDPEYVRITEWVEVEFPDIKKEEIIKDMVSSLDKQIEVERAESHSRVNRLLNKRQELLALPQLKECIE